MLCWGSFITSKLCLCSWIEMTNKLSRRKRVQTKFTPERDGLWECCLAAFNICAVRCFEIRGRVEVVIGLRFKVHALDPWYTTSNVVLPNFTTLVSLENFRLTFDSRCTRPSQEEIRTIIFIPSKKRLQVRFVEFQMSYVSWFYHDSARWSFVWTALHTWLKLRLSSKSMLS